MYSTSSLQGVWHHIHDCPHQICQCKVQFDQYVTTNIGVLFPYMVSLYNAVATSCNQSFYRSHQGGNSQLQSSCNQLRFSPVASPSEKLQLDFKTLAFGVDTLWIKWFICTPLFTFKIHCSVDQALSRGLVCRWLSIGKTAAVLIQVLKEEKGKESNILDFQKLSKKKSRSDLHTWDECLKNKEVNWR